MASPLNPRMLRCTCQTPPAPISDQVKLPQIASSHEATGLAFVLYPRPFRDAQKALDHQTPPLREVTDEYRLCSAGAKEPHGTTGK
jgi:hypothetical protein